MGNDKNILAMTVKKIAEKMAAYAGGTASGWGMYQPKEPKMISKSKK